MHRVFDIPELVEQIIKAHELSSGDLLHFGLACSSFLALAVPILWGSTTVTLEAIDNLWPPGNLFNSEQTSEIEWMSRTVADVTGSDCGALKHYARNVRTLHLIDPGMPNTVVVPREPRGFFYLIALLETLSESGAPPLFPNLRSLSVCSECWSIPPLLNALLGPNIIELVIYLEHDPDETLTALLEACDAFAAGIATALLSGINLTRFKLIAWGPGIGCTSLAIAMALSPALLALKNLRDVTITLGPILTLDILHALASLPHLQQATIQQFSIPPSALPAPHLPSDAFPELQHLEVSFFLGYADVLRWISTPPIPGLHFEGDDWDRVIVGTRGAAGKGASFKTE